MTAERSSGESQESNQPQIVFAPGTNEQSRTIMRGAEQIGTVDLFTGSVWLENANPYVHSASIPAEDLLLVAQGSVDLIRNLGEEKELSDS